jgi:hypothetical protein
MRFPTSIGPWGSRPLPAPLLAAFAPVLAAFGFVFAAFAFAGWIWFADRGPLAPPPVTITALKPVAGSADVSTALPIEVLYGIPTAETLHLWQPGR